MTTARDLPATRVLTTPVWKRRQEYGQESRTVVGSLCELGYSHGF